jgi:cellulose synthase/poly-beta-1,6-N-acetylglucosamine synthase-like glycosyltransferase
MAWFIGVYAVLTSVSALSLALLLARRFRSGQASGAEAHPPDSVSVLVPIKGVDERTPEVLQSLVSSALPGEVEFIFAMESEDDPAFQVCTQLQRDNPARDIKIVISGEARELMGKQHNLAHAFSQSRGQTIVCMDADIDVGPDTIREGIGHLDEDAVGSAFFLPVYRGDAPWGGRFAEIYLNYQYNLFMGSLATLTEPPYIFGGLWMTRRASLEQTGGFKSFGRTVSDDAAIGRAFLKLGLKNRLIPGTVSTPTENLGVAAGLKHLGKWIGMLRAEGIVPYFVIWLWWHPVFWSGFFFVLGIATGWLNGASIIYAAVAVGFCLVAKTASGVILDVGVYGHGAFRSIVPLLLYEVFVVPVVFGLGLFRRSIMWKGRRYRLGPRGMVLGLENLD